MRRILVTGATGNIGGHLLSMLADTPGIETVAGYRRPSDAPVLHEAGATPVWLEMDRIDSMPAALQGVDALFLLKPYTIKMLIQAKQLLDCAHHAGVRHIVHLGAHGNDDTPWAIIGWHHMVERYIEALDFEWTHLRPNFFMENLIKGINRDKGELYHYLAPHVPVSWIACRDIALAAHAALTRPAQYQGQKLHLASEASTLSKLAEKISFISKKPYRYVQLGPELGLKAMTKLGREPEFVQPWLDYMAAICAGRVREIDYVFTSPGITHTSLSVFIQQNNAEFRS